MRHKSVFHNNLKLARKTRGYTQDEIAKLLNIAKSTYCHYENGNRKPNIDTLERIARILYISIDELFK
ncbi:MAG: helix-turn-helix transcriptional regulator [Clostridiales bacterium]|nr:helix-turn-helix transcriptional regulator [Clostridiales bacterium]